MRAHYLQHVPFEGLGSIEPWLIAAGYDVTSSLLFESASFPAPEDIDFLVIMGGPMSVNDETDLPWLVVEKEFIRRVINLGKPVLGVCLGAQLIASAMGARVYSNREKEIGWFPVERLPPANHTNFRFPPSIEVFHWHGETFSLPPDAIRLAKSEGCENQAFQLGQRVIGLQFHLEMTAKAVREIVVNGRKELQPSKFVQSESAILTASLEKYRAINNLMIDVLRFLTRTDN